MANHYSALKRVRQEARRTEVNRGRRSRLRHQIRAMRRVLDEKDANAAQTLLAATFSMIDKAAKWGIVKQNAAARYKSRLHARLKSLTPAAA
jgi:small subunit ribosomal protein S20